MFGQSQAKRVINSHAICRQMIEKETISIIRCVLSVVLLIMPLASLRQWMAAAYTANMATGSYAFIYVSIDMPTTTVYSKLTSESLWQQGQTDDSNVKQAMQSLLIVSRIIHKANTHSLLIMSDYFLRQSKTQFYV
jgi:hypothetical protein